MDFQKAFGLNARVSPVFRPRRSLKKTLRDGLTDCGTEIKDETTAEHLLFNFSIVDKIKSHGRASSGSTCRKICIRARDQERFGIEGDLRR